MKLSRRLPLEQLAPPETDVRQGRPTDQIQSLASSMGDPSVGQLQPILCHPAEPEYVPDDPDRETFQKVVDNSEAFRIVDGQTRYLAAEELGWHDIWAWVWPSPPDNTVVAQLDANTEGIEMSEYETVAAIIDHKEETGKTWDEVASEVGYSPSYLSQVSSALDGPDHIVEAWQSPETPIETGHVLDLMKLDDPEVRDILLDQAIRHDLSVGQLRDRIKSKMREMKKQERAKASPEERQQMGQAERAKQQAQQGVPDGTPDETCTVCGDEAKTMVAVPVCEQDYGMMQDARASDSPLMASGQRQDPQPPQTQEEAQAPASPAKALAEATGIPPEQAMQVIQEVKEQAQSPPAGGPNE